MTPSPERIGTLVLMGVPVRDLTAVQLAKVASAWSGELVRAALAGDDRDYVVAVEQAIAVCLAEFVRRCRDVDPPVPRTEE